ncbi:MAG TPA: hypothetical protein VFV00_20285 [Acidimicrobiales bacterium]|nr:hypothetical protein [Acidimicrobiales bacterium]
MRRKALMLTCGALLLAAACGSDSGKAQPAPFVEKSAAISSGDSICKSLASSIVANVSQFKQQHPNATDAEARDFLVNTLLPSIDEHTGALHRIGEPTKDRTQFDEAIGALDKDVSALKDSVSNDPQKVLAAPIVVFNNSARLFVAYGFKECGKSSP